MGITFTLLMRMKLVQQHQVNLVTMDTNLQALLDIVLKKNFQALSLFIDIGKAKMKTISTPQMLMKLGQCLLEKSESMAISMKALRATFYLHRCFDSSMYWNSWY